MGAGGGVRQANLSREWDRWIEQNRSVLRQDGTKWELEFVDKVLRHVPGLHPDTVSAQTEFRDLDRRRRRIDFTIAEGANVRIALEVDGYDKTGSGEGMSSDDFKDWNVRELSIKAAGWHLLRFANGLIYPRRKLFIEQITLHLKALRTRADEISRNAEVARREQFRATRKAEEAQAAQEALERRVKVEQELRELKQEQMRETADRDRSPGKPSEPDARKRVRELEDSVSEARKRQREAETKLNLLRTQQLQQEVERQGTGRDDRQDPTERQASDEMKHALQVAEEGLRESNRKLTEVEQLRMAQQERLDAAEARERERTEQVLHLERNAEEAKARQHEAEQKLRDLELEQQRADAERLSEEDRDRLEELEDELDKERDRRRRTEKDNKGMKVIGASAFAAIVVIVVVFFVVVGSDKGQPLSPDQVRCDAAISSEEIGSREVGSPVNVKGQVEGARHVSTGTERVYLNIGRDYPDQHVTVIIWGDNLPNWKVSPEAKYDGLEIAVRGTLDEYKGDLQVEANSPNDIAVCE